jgi:hypothetical protein
MKHVAWLILILAALILVSCGGSGDEEASGGAGETMAQETESDTDESAEENGESSADGFKEINQQGFVFRWRIEEETLHVVLRHPTTGWVAVGFDPSRMMKDANMILGYVSDGEVFITDHYGVANTSHRADTEIDGTNDIIYSEGSEGAEGTELRFAIPLDSGDDADRPLEPGQSYRVLFAHGPDGADDFSTYHGGRTGVDVTL